jgi:hypothetical protein
VDTSPEFGRGRTPVAKPCTRQEVEFYESSALHPALREFMPLYMGSLSGGIGGYVAGVREGKDAGFSGGSNRLRLLLLGR